MALDAGTNGRPVGASGLTAAEVAARVALGQVNVADQATSRPLRTIVRTNVLTRFNAVLGTLAVLVLATGSWKDATFGLVMVVNSLVGIVQEVRAKRTLDALAVLNTVVVRVRRDGATVEIAPDAIVLGDALELRAGDQVPADGRVVTTVGLEVDESLLTGESDAVAKAGGDEVRSGSIVVAGSGLVVTTAVGADAYARRLAADARRFTVTRSELVMGTNRLLTYLSWALLAIGPLLLWSELRANRAWHDAVTGTAAGLVGMVPEGLVLLTTLAFVIATVSLARRHVLVQELPAVEGLARVDVVCIDKTGTITEGDLDLASVELVQAAGAGDDEHGDDENHVDVDVVLAALAAAPEPNATMLAVRRVRPHDPGWVARTMVPFSGARKWSGIDFGDHGVFVIGAPEIVLAGGHRSLRSTVDAIAATGQRVLVVGRAEGALPSVTGSAPLPVPPVRPLALLRFDERVRADAPDTLRYFAEQGVAVKVISGDNPRTVGAVAARVGLAGAERTCDARTLPDDEAALAEALETHDVFGRVTPHQKRAMVRALQSRGHVVAMTGDGVNDALALKDADIGVAMGSGSAATRAVAQLVLVDDRFAQLPRVVAEGRRVIANIERVANLFVVKNVYAALLAVAVAVARVPYPFLPRHLTVISTLTIGVPAFVLALAPNPTRYRPGFLRRVLGFSLPTGAVTAAGIFVSYWVAREFRSAPDEARTAACVTAVVAGLWVVVLLSTPVRGWKLALVAVMAGAFAVAMAVAPIRDFFALSVPLRGVGESVALGAVTGLSIGVAKRLRARRT